METELRTAGGLQTVWEMQIVYLDFDGAETSYRGETGTIEHVSVADSGLTAAEKQSLLDRLNGEFSARGVVFTAEKPADGEYSTVFIGHTGAFDYSGLAETIDKDNANKSDNAFVNLSGGETSESIAAAVAHEVEHIVFGLDHGGGGLNRYAKTIVVSSGVVSSYKGTDVTSDNLTILSGGIASAYWMRGGTITISSGGQAGGLFAIFTSASQMNFLPGAIVRDFSTLRYANEFSNGDGTKTFSSVTFYQCKFDLTIWSTANITFTATLAPGAVMRACNVGWRTIVSSGAVFDGNVVDDNMMGSSVICLDGTRPLSNTLKTEDVYFGSSVFPVMIASSGAIVSGTTVYNGHLIVSSGGSALTTVVNGYETKSVDAESYSRFINGSMSVLSGGVAIGVRVSSGGRVMVDGSSVRNYVYSGGLMAVQSGGTASSGIVYGGGSCVVIGSGAKASGMTILGEASAVVSAAAMAFTVSSGGVMIVSSSGALWLSDIDRGGRVQLSLDGTAALTTVMAGGVMYVGVSGSAFGNTVSSGGHIMASSGGSAYGNLILAGGSMTAAKGGDVSGNIVSGLLTVQNAGWSTGDTIAPGGRMVQESGGGVSGTTVQGTMSAFGSSWDCMAESGGLIAVSSGTVFRCRAFSGGTVKVLGGGVASAGVADNGGKLIVSSGGSAIDAVIFGGELTVSSGGVAAQTVVSSGGTLVADTGGTLTETFVWTGGTLRVTGGANLNDNLYLAGNMIVDGKANMLLGTVVFSLGNIDRTGRATARLDNYANLLGAAYAVSSYPNAADCRSNGLFALIGNVSAFSESLSVLDYNSVSVGTLKVGGTLTSGYLTYSLRLEDGTLKIEVVGKYDTLYGKVAYGNANLNAYYCRVKSIIAASETDITGNAVSEVDLLAQASPCNVYGGGNNVNVGGNIDLALTGGGYSGIVYGGSRAYAKNVTVHDIAVSVGGIVHSDNQKLIAAGKGNSAWIVGGGVADNAQTLTAGAVNITLDGANVVRVVGGAQAQNAGSTATVESVNITVRNSTLAGDLFGGGYAYNGGTSVVSGGTFITIDTTAANVTVMGNIYGGGANPSYYSKGGSTPVNGGSTVTFTGLGEKLTVGTVSGDGMIAGMVSGVRTLEFRDFFGEISANVKNFDLLKFAGTSEITAGPGYEAGTFKFDLTGRDASYQGVAFIQDASAFTFADGDKLLQVELGASSGNYDLMAVDDEYMLDGLKVELFKNDALLCSFNYGETKDGYALEFANGMLSLAQA
ncbi:MAG: hypothetical protein PHI85_08135 [Victivallaceae bacterium]|nr:hypothetical protein [Victivallaceae bacterium]